MLVLRGGTVLDGSGTPGVTSDVVIDEGRIVEVGTAGEAGRTDGTPNARVVDVDGAVVCPGFIDLHSHTDFTIPSAPTAITQATQGVTTLVTGNCGYSPFPISREHADELFAMAGFLAEGLSWDWTTAEEYAEAVRALPLGVNLAPQVGHNALRIAAMGAADRAPTAAELQRMQALLRESAPYVVGFSTGLIYAPGSYSDTDELAAIATTAAEEGLLYSTHMRNEGSQLLAAIDEALEVARRSGVRLEISHLKAAGADNWGTVGEALARIEAARRDGVDVAADQYPYTASSTTLTVMLPDWALDGGSDALVARLDAADERARITAAIDPALRIDRLVIADTPDDGPYHRFTGYAISDVAADLGLGAAEVVVELLRGQRGRVGIVHHGMAEDDVRTIMARSDVAVASDSHTPGCPGRGRPHPRGLGTFTRVLGHYARDEAVIDLPTAVRKMTGLPASRLGWTDRGVIRPGAVADVTVFDPAVVVDRATFEDPWQLSQGVLHTFVGGTATLEAGAPTGAGPGVVLTRDAEGGPRS